MTTRTPSENRWSTPRIVGIVNITEDSFSDGGRYLTPAHALEHARSLAESGADVIELGPASSHPEARPVSAEAEIKRLEPVLPELVAQGLHVSVDSSQAATQAWALEQGVAYLNDTRGFPCPEAVAGLPGAGARLIVMHSLDPGGQTPRRGEPERVVEQVETFFGRRLEVLRRAGIARERIILDPGMGLFLGTEPDASLRVLRALPGLRERFGLPLLISVSRKSFLQALAGRDAQGADAATLAAELFAARAGVDYLRTHSVGALRDALRIQAAIEAAPAPAPFPT